MVFSPKSILVLYMDSPGCVDSLQLVLRQHHIPQMDIKITLAATTACTVALDFLGLEF